MRVKQDRFRDWNIYHKSVVLFLSAIGVWVLIHAYFSWDGAYQETREVSLPYSAENLWPLLTGDEMRDLWFAELIDVNGLSGKEATVGATRLLFWKHRYKRWHSVERITDLVPNRLFKTIQESDHETRWLHVELKPISPCETHITLQEIIYPTAYKDRFWFFRDFTRHEQRLDDSMQSLATWAEKKDTRCGQ